MSAQYTGMEQSNLAWHPAFIQAIQMELEDYQDDLEFLAEYQLTAEPLRIDCLVIKKAKDVVIKKNIAAIFRDVNLIEYKSPGDYVSVSDFYKVYAYACLNASLEKVPFTDLTLTFVESHYPRELLKHLQEIRSYKVEEKLPGIYTVSGDILPIQIIDNRRLSADENIWLKDLDNKLNALDLGRITVKIFKQGKAARVKAYLDVILRANFHAIKEARNMSSTAKSLDDVLIEIGLNAKWEAEGVVIGEERKALDIAQNMVNLGFPLETIVSVTMLDEEKVKPLFQQSK